MMSGDALSRNHRCSSLVIATQSCVRGSTPAPRRAASQISHPQFHCGTPPPAALPKTIARMACSGGCGRVVGVLRAIGLDRSTRPLLKAAGDLDIHAVLGAEVDLVEFGSDPGAVAHRYDSLQTVCASLGDRPLQDVESDA